MHSESIQSVRVQWILKVASTQARLPQISLRRKKLVTHRDNLDLVRIRPSVRFVMKFMKDPKFWHPRNRVRTVALLPHLRHVFNRGSHVYSVGQVVWCIVDLDVPPICQATQPFLLNTGHRRLLWLTNPVRNEWGTTEFEFYKILVFNFEFLVFCFQILIN